MLLAYACQQCDQIGKVSKYLATNSQTNVGHKDCLLLLGYFDIDQLSIQIGENPFDLTHLQVDASNKNKWTFSVTEENAEDKQYTLTYVKQDFEGNPIVCTEQDLMVIYI